jgi:hypothetical protein
MASSKEREVGMDSWPERIPPVPRNKRRVARSAPLNRWFRTDALLTAGGDRVHGRKTLRPGEGHGFMGVSCGERVSFITEDTNLGKGAFNRRRRGDQLRFSLSAT